MIDPRMEIGAVATGRRARLPWWWLPLLLLPLACGAAEHAGQPLQDRIGEVNHDLVLLEQALDSDAPIGEIDREWERVNDYRKLSRQCMDEQGATLEQVANDLELLGAGSATEPSEVRLSRRTLERERESLERLVANCRLLLIKSDRLLDALMKRRGETQRETLLARGPNLYGWLVGGTEQIKAQPPRPVPRIAWGFELLDAEWWGLLIALNIALLAFLLRLRSRGLLGPVAPVDGGNFAEAVRAAFLQAFRRVGVPLLFSGGWLLFWWAVQGYARHPLLLTAASMLLFLWSLIALIGGIFFDPVRPLLGHEVERARRFQRALRLALRVTGIGGIGYLLLPLELLLEPWQAGFRLCYISLFVYVIGRLSWAFLGLSTHSHLRFLRFPILILLGVGWILEGTGFRNYSVYLLGAVSGTLLVVGGGTLASIFVREMIESIASGSYRWQVWMRRSLGINAGESVPGLFWARLIVAASVWFGVLLALLQLWGVSASARAQLYLYLMEGIRIGELNIVPSRILLAIGLLSLLMYLTAWFKARMDQAWLRRSGFDAGTRNAIVAVSGYVGGTIAILVALGVAGLDFGNLAIIAGALSVGIGFGLQNIVNNFVSGLILLFERPIRKGDWIVVGGTEGYVQDISIRSTQIRTFDRADVIIPNSELISGQVTNWMLRDLRGRAKVPVGVSYASDPERVRDLLLELGNAHPMVITDGSVPRPYVLFMGLGDSSLDFELRCVIRNVDERMTVISDLLFAIVKRFRQEGIEIPFPQRDLHLRSLPAHPSGLGLDDLAAGGAADRDDHR